PLLRPAAPSPLSPLLPYTTLFRSARSRRATPVRRPAAAPSSGGRRRAPPHVAAGIGSPEPPPAPSRAGRPPRGPVALGSLPYRLRLGTRAVPERYGDEQPPEPRPCGPSR